jgi:hypothetical protein
MQDFKNYSIKPRFCSWLQNLPEGPTKHSLSGLTLTKNGKEAIFSSLLRRNFATAKFGINKVERNKDWGIQ